MPAWRRCVNNRRCVNSSSSTRAGVGHARQQRDRGVRVCSGAAGGGGIDSVCVLQTVLHNLGCMSTCVVVENLIAAAADDGRV